MAEHIKAELEKFHNRTNRSGDTLTCAETTISQLNANDIMILPFTVDHLGALGPSASALLDKATVSAPLPDLDESDFRFPAAFQAYTTTTGSVAATDLLPRADALWTAHTSDWFGPTYHTTTPGQWARKTLGLNICTHLAAHFFTSKSNLENSTHPTELPRSFLTQPISTKNPSSLLQIGPHRTFTTG